MPGRSDTRALLRTKEPLSSALYRRTNTPPKRACLAGGPPGTFRRLGWAPPVTFCKACLNPAAQHEGSQSMESAGTAKSIHKVSRRWKALWLPWLQPLAFLCRAGFKPQPQQRSLEAFMNANNHNSIQTQKKIAMPLSLVPCGACVKPVAQPEPNSSAKPCSHDHF